MKILHEVLEIYVYQTCRRDVTEEVLQNFKSIKHPSQCLSLLLLLLVSRLDVIVLADGLFKLYCHCSLLDYSFFEEFAGALMI